MYTCNLTLPSRSYRHTDVVFQYSHREYVTLTGDKTKPEDRDKRDDFPDLVFTYNKEADSYTYPRGKVKN